MPKDHSAVGARHARVYEGEDLDHPIFGAGCTRTKQTAWIEDQFTVTSSAGIRNREKRVADIVVRELKRAKPDVCASVWG